MHSLRQILIVLGLATVLTAFVAPAATPKLAAVAQVGPPAAAGQHRVLLLWHSVDGYQPTPAYAVHRKAGAADSPSEFQLLAVVQPTAHVPTLTLILQEAAAAGLALDGLDTALNGVLGAAATNGSLAEKIALALTTELPPAGAQLFHDLLPRLHPPLALALGRGYLATVPGTEPSTFEVREYLPEHGTEGDVVASLTTGLAPTLLAAPGSMSERVDTSPRGHLRVQLRWCTPLPLAQQGLHVAGYQIFRADRNAWLAAHGAVPPAALTPEALAAALAAGHLVPVNRNPVQPDPSYSCLVPPVSDLFFTVDDNDSASLLRHEPGGVPFTPGQQVTYYVSALDHFRRPGMPSPGLNVTVCDRMPPTVPRELKVENRPHYDDATQIGGENLVLSWVREHTNVVSHYWVYRWNSHDDALRHATQPGISNLLARVPNTGVSARVEFADDGSQQLPTAPPAPSLPADAGRTFWYTVRNEDPAACPSPEGFGNLSGPGAPAFGVLRDWTGPGVPDGRLTTPCCLVTASFVPVTAQHASASAVRMELIPGDPRITWVEIREAISGQPIRRYHLEHAWPAAFEPLDLSGFASFRLEARFGTSAGHASAWTPGLNASASGQVPLHRWTAAVACSTRPWPCGPGLVDPVDPGSGEVTGTCGELAATPGAVEWRVYRRTDGHPRLVQIESGKFPEADWCDTATPAVPATLCYYAQTFDGDGNPSAITRLGCVESLGTEPMPKPVINHAMILPSTTQPPVVVPGSVQWFCPPPGVERFEVAFLPPPPGSPVTAWLVVPGAQEVIATEYGVFTSPRIPAGFGSGGPEFAQTFNLLAAESYRVRVRAVRSHIADDGVVSTAYGPWSDEVPVSQVQGVAAQGPEVPWPARPVPPIHPDLSPRAEYDAQEQLCRVEIGTIDASDVINPGTGTTPAVIRASSLLPYLTVAPPFVAYRHQSSENRRGEMTQISPLFRDFLGTVTPDSGGPVLQITDRFLVVKRRNNEPAGPYRIWLRDTQPVIRGHAYRYTLVRHHADLEIAEILASNPASVPN